MSARLPNPKDYEALRDASGWYLAAWRDFRNLTLEELANEAGTSKGTVSDLETGKQKKDGSKPLRFNRDWVDLMARALGTTGGHLIDVNPFTVGGDAMALFARVAPEDRARVLQIVATFTKADGR